jgi:20S proteasome alpha/beta subunit
MTVLVGIRCKNGLVIGADSSATFGDGERTRTIEQLTDKKIAIIGENFIVAGTGYVGHHQRFVALINEHYDKGTFLNKPYTEIAKLISNLAINEFASTQSPKQLYSAMVGFSCKSEPYLYEYSGPASFQPEMKDPNDMWFASMGSGQSIADPFLALFRQIFWQGSLPNLQGGIFTALWALVHACEVNPGGIKEPIHICVIERSGQKFKARKLSEDELLEHRNMVASATSHFAEFKKILSGEISTATPPPNPT